MPAAPCPSGYQFSLSQGVHVGLSNSDVPLRYLIVYIRSNDDQSIHSISSHTPRTYGLTENAGLDNDGRIRRRGVDIGGLDAEGQSFCGVT